jgi:hypothetical protein
MILMWMPIAGDNGLGTVANLQPDYSDEEALQQLEVWQEVGLKKVRLPNVAETAEPRCFAPASLALLRCNSSSWLRLSLVAGV